MPKIHPTAVLEGDVQLAPGVVVGPWCVLNGTLGPIIVGSGSVLRANVHLTGPLTLGDKNDLYPFVCLGGAPQDLGTSPDTAGPGLIIGSGNVFRESATLSRPKMQAPGRVGNSNYFMAYSHAGHDCLIGNNNVFGNCTQIAGHVEIADKVITGGNSCIHQFVRVGRGAFFSGLSGSTLDLCPFFVMTGVNYVGSINIVGLRRSGASPQTIDTVRWVYRTLCRSNLLPRNALDALRSRQGDSIVDEYIAFIEGSKRGITTARGRQTEG